MTNLLSGLVALGPGVLGGPGGTAQAVNADPVYVAAGDIACPSTDSTDSNHCQMGATAAEVKNHIQPQGLFILGDAQYSSAGVVTQGVGVTLTDYNENYGTTWGGIPTAKQYPTPGHYDWGDRDERGTSPLQQTPDYFSYFSGLSTVGTEAAGALTACLASSPPCADWYSFNVNVNGGAWHVISLDSACGAMSGGCGAGSAEETFLKTDLAANTNACVLAFWHDPLFQSGDGGKLGTGVNSLYSAWWHDLYAAHATIVLGGQDHDYEDFAPVNPSEVADPSEGLKQFIVGSGGRDHDNFISSQPNTIFRDNTNFGVLKLTFHAQSADYAFLDTGNTSHDSGTVGCVVAPSTPAGVTATAGNRSASVTWTYSSPGNRPPDSFTVTPYVGSVGQSGLAQTVTGTATSTTMTGLTNGTSYTFKVTATNSKGTGGAATSNAITPVSVPGAPASVFAAAGDANATVSWTAPSDTGGLPLNGFTITPLIGGTPQPSVSAGASATSMVVTHLSNGTTYSFTVAASNSVGTGPPSSPSNLVTPFAPGGGGPGGGGGPTGSGGPAGGYWAVASDGGIFNYGDAGFFGSAGAIHLNRPIVGMAPTPDGGGYWLVADDGGIFTYGDANFYGSTGGMHLNKPIVGMAATPDGKGYWLVANDGGIFTYGDAGFFGSAGGIHLNKPILGIAPTTDGGGYWLVANDGGIFNYGDASFLGSAGGIHLNKPIVGMAPTVDGGGYWLVATDGGIFTYGDATFQGSAGGIQLNQPIVGMADTPDGRGYWLVASDGGIFTYGDATFLGSAGGLHLVKPVVALARTAA